jgi:hypothetical protein
MDGTVATVVVAVVGMLVLGILGVIALSKKGRIKWQSGEVEVEGGTRRR